MSAFAGALGFGLPVTGQEAHWQAAGRVLGLETQTPYTVHGLGLLGRVWESEDAVLVYEGALTGRTSLARSLGRAASQDDGALVLAAWQRWGRSCPAHLEGSYAFAVYDKHREALYLVRDALGGRPLYYAQREGVLLFASTLPALLCFPAVKAELSRQGIYELILLGPGKTPGSGILREVWELQPGQWAAFDRTALTLGRHWALRADAFNDTFATAADTVRELVTQAVLEQTDGRVCAFLSGGLDSSIVSTLACGELGGLSTYSVDYRGNQENFQAGGFQPEADGAYVQTMREFLHTDHHDVLLDTPDLAASLEDAMLARGLPGMADVDSALLLLCRRAAEGYDAALSGECADELFGGYPWYRETLPDTFPWAGNVGLRASFLRPEYSAWQDPEAFVSGRYQAALAAADTDPDAPEALQSIQRMMSLNLGWFMQTLMDRNDRMGRAAGLTLRAPFCNAGLAQYLYNLPWAWRRYRDREKGLLRYAFRDLLPESVLWRKKSPFPKTWNPDYRTAAENLLREELSQADCPLFSFLQPQALWALLDRTEPLPWYGQLMNTPQVLAYFYQLSRWLRHFDVTVL